MSTPGAPELEPLAADEDEFLPVVSSANEDATTAAATTEETNDRKLTAKHHRRNSTVQEQRAIRAKALEAERMMSMPKVRRDLV